ncbi:beta-N-acetylhexosaminidase [Flavonifractor sp. An306]|mgnify:FL=1|uniref:beta-N-acetylhexosaminidase n=1 Tax=Flavonifractor sp. An306 TaxID=1965629 RepID=UPI00174B58FF|nr:beta-N-acetylhexosaminidase [Flavonifractor sp. An306]
MDLRQAVGQRIMAGFPGTEIDETFAALVRTHKIGNVILFRRNIESREQLTRLCRELKELIRAETGAEPLIAIDQEGGVVTRLSDDMLNTPGAMALAAAGGDAPYRAGLLTARELRSCGVNFNLAPVLDVNSNPANPVIGVRSFGDDPERASELALAFMRGTLEGGVMACGKHFPGHGDTAVDSHLGLPLVEKGREELERCELPPFRKAIGARIPAIMTSHVLFPKLEPERLPATMSRRLLTGLLREELGFGGVIISDCMEMDAIAKFYGTVEGAVASIAAGADIVCISHTAALAQETVERLLAGLEDGSLPKAEFDRSLERLARAKSGLSQADGLPGATEADAREVRQMLERSLTLLYGPMPELGERPFFVGCGPARASLVSSHVRETPAFPEYMARALGGYALVTSDDPEEGEIARAVQAAAESSCIVLGTCNAHLKAGQLALMEALGALGKPMAVAALRNPYDLLNLPQGAAGIAAWEYTARGLEALAPLLARKRQFTGVMPLIHSVF